jgi:hypothetical protein
MFQSFDLSAFLKCPSHDKIEVEVAIEEEEEVGHTELANSATQMAMRQSPEIIDLRGDDDDIDMDRAQGWTTISTSGRKRALAQLPSHQRRQAAPTGKQPRTSPRCMAKGIRIIKDKGLRYKMDEMNHPVCDYLED